MRRQEEPGLQEQRRLLQEQEPEVQEPQVQAHEEELGPAAAGASKRLGRK
jgi:hypothetical protein